MRRYPERFTDMNDPLLKASNVDTRTEDEVNTSFLEDVLELVLKAEWSPALGRTEPFEFDGLADLAALVLWEVSLKTDFFGADRTLHWSLSARQRRQVAPSVTTRVSLTHLMPPWL